MNGQAFYSGQYRTWYGYRELHVVRKCSRILLRGVRRAWCDNGKIQQVEFKINGMIQTGWERDRDRIKLAIPLEKGIYHIEFQIVYSDLDKAKYSCV